MADTIRLVTRGDDSGSARTANEAIRDAYCHAGPEPGSVGPDRDGQRRRFMGPRILDACGVGRAVPIPYTVY